MNAKTNSSIEQRRVAAMPRGVAVTCDIYADQADNSLLRDVEGREYIDFAAGIAVLNTGHRHPEVMQAVVQQLDRFTHTSYQVVPYESAVALAERINASAPISGPAKTAFFTTGAEAVENAVKIARSHTGRSGVIAFGGAFHGRTLLGMALTGKVAPYKIGFGTLPGDVYHVPFPSESQKIRVDDSLSAINNLFKTDVDPKRIAAIIIEPVQGEGGFNPAPPALMKGIRDICDEHGIVLIADEIQTGFARTGKLFAMDHFTVKADLVTMAKSLAGGFPLSAVCGRTDIMDAPSPGGLGGTYAANPLGVAAAHAVLDVITRENLCERASILGHRLTSHLESLRPRFSFISDIRGLGSMVAMELNDPSTGAPDPQRVKRVQRKAMELGLILLSCGMYGNVIRFLHPLTIEDDLFARALGIITEALHD